MGSNSFYISGNGNECPLQLSYLLIYFTRNVNMTSLTVMFMTLVSCDSIWHVWRGLEQSLIAVDQWPTRMRACVCANSGHFEYTL